MKIKLSIITVFFFFLAENSYSQVVVIVNKSVPDNSLTANQLLDIYSLSKKKWSDGNNIVVFDLKSHEATAEKFYGFIGKSHSDIKKLWMKLQLTGEGSAPAALSSDDEVLSKVASTPGSIGFVGSSKTNNNVKELVTIK